jgi:hypothetical protein
MAAAGYGELSLWCKLWPAGDDQVGLVDLAEGGAETVSDKKRGQINRQNDY